MGSRRDSIQSRISGQIRTSATQVIVRSMPASDTAAWNSSNTALIRAAVLSGTVEDVGRGDDVLDAVFGQRPCQHQSVFHRARAVIDARQDVYVQI